MSSNIAEKHKVGSCIHSQPHCKTNQNCNNDVNSLRKNIPNEVTTFDTSAFKDHFVIKKGNRQNHIDEANIGTNVSGSLSENVKISRANQGKSLKSIESIPWKSNGSEKDVMLETHDFSPQSFSVPCTSVSLKASRRFSDVNQQAQNGRTEDIQSLLSNNTNEPNIVTSIPATLSEARNMEAHADYSRSMKGKPYNYLKSQDHTRRQRLVDEQKTQEHAIEEKQFSLSFSSTTSSQGKYTSGKPNVYRSNLTNGAIPLFPIPLMNTVHRDGIIFEEDLKTGKSTMDVPPTVVQSDVTNNLRSVPSTSFNIPVPVSPVIVSNNVSIYDLSDTKLRPVTAPPASMTSTKSTFDEDDNDLKGSKNLPEESPDVRRLHHNTSHSLSPIASSKSSDSITPNHIRSAKSFLPFPMGKSNRKSEVINRFLATDLKPLKPLAKGDRLIDENSREERGSNVKIRIAPPLDFDDRRQPNSSLSGVFGRSSGPKLGMEPQLPQSPMERDYHMISRYMIKSSDQKMHSNTVNSDADSVFNVCGQKMPIPMHLIFNGLENLEKVGEGVFGEVFLGYFVGNKKSMRVYKIVAIEGSTLVNGEKQKTFSEILPEIIISQEVSKLHVGYRKCFTDGFIKMYNALITVGTYPTALVESWKKWNIIHDSDNDCPSFKMDQLYIVFEYDHGGDDVESFRFENARQTFYLAMQVVHILAVGECAMELEHRDLHWGNVLVEKTECKEITFHMSGKTMMVPSSGVKACIIDFTISRIVDRHKRPLFLELKDDEEQFLGTGDHQFDIYRMMRDFNRNNWSPFSPKTNIFWVHYLAEKLFLKARYMDTSSDTHAFFLKELRQLKDLVMEYESCTEFAFSQTCEQLQQLKVPSAVRNKSKKCY